MLCTVITIGEHRYCEQDVGCSDDVVGVPNAASDLS